MIQIVVILLCELLLIVLAVYIIFSWIRSTPFYPSSTKKLFKLIEDEKIDLNGRRFIDIGSGDGRFVFEAVRNGYFAEGIEFNPFLTLFSRLRLFTLGKKGMWKIYNKDFFKHIYDKYDLVYLYIYSEYMDKIEKKLFSELPKGSLIISKAFNFSKRKEDRKIGEYYIYYIK